MKNLCLMFFYRLVLQLLSNISDWNAWNCFSNASSSLGCWFCIFNSLLWNVFLASFIFFILLDFLLELLRKPSLSRNSFKSNAFLFRFSLFGFLSLFGYNRKIPKLRISQPMKILKFLLAMLSMSLFSRPREHTLFTNFGQTWLQRKYSKILKF